SPLLGRGREAMTYGRERTGQPRADVGWRGRKSFGRAGEGGLSHAAMKAPSSARLAGGEPRRSHESAYLVLIKELPLKVGRQLWHKTASDASDKRRPSCRMRRLHS